MINNRQAGRRRGRGGGNNGQRPGGTQGNGSRIDSRARGNASQLYEKYKNMAADAQRAGDRVNTEYFLQFADHYFRVLSEQRGRFEDQQQPRRPRDEFDDDGNGQFGAEFGGDEGDEGEPVRARDGWSDGDGREDRDERPREDRPRDDRPRGDRPREFRRDENEPRRNANGNGDGRPQGRGEWQERDRQDGYRPDRNRPDGNRPDGNRLDGNRQEGADRSRERRPEPPVEVAGQHRADAVLPTESLNARAEEVLAADRPLDAPRRRGRPRRDEAPVEPSSGFEADRLPPSLSASLTLAANDEEPAAKPRRRRARPAEEAPAAE